MFTDEGIIFKFLNNPVAIKANEDGWVEKMEIVKQELGEPDASGRRSPVPIEGSNYDIDVDTVVIAIGQSPNPLIRHTTPGLDVQKWGAVILAMGAGKKAAAAIDKKLRG